AFQPIQLARMFSLFTDLLGSLSRTGRSPLLTKIGLGEIHETEDLEVLELHESSTRIEIAALKVDHDLLERGWSRYLAQATATRMIIDQICYGRYRQRDLREITALQLVHRVATNMKLIADSANYNTNLISEKLLSSMSSPETKSVD
ncbi:MAG: hypothetical protein KDK27_18595, partial [Leptospiraceae bacterium]|nr:hypothetical protein [Leptospiraceae bacterium]